MPEVGAGSTGTTSASVHPSFSQLPLMSAHRRGRENKHWIPFHTRALHPSALLCPVSKEPNCWNHIILQEPFVFLHTILLQTTPRGHLKLTLARLSQSPKSLPWSFRREPRGSSLASVLSQLLRTGTLSKPFQDDSHW